MYVVCIITISRSKVHNCIFVNTKRHFPLFRSLGGLVRVRLDDLAVGRSEGLFHNFLIFGNFDKKDFNPVPRSLMYVVKIIGLINYFGTPPMTRSHSKVWLLF